MTIGDNADDSNDQLADIITTLAWKSVLLIAISLDLLG